MGFFGSSTDDAVSEEVEKATTEKNVEEDWATIMGICDKASKSNEDAKAYIKAIVKRLNNPDPHIGVKAVTLLDACVKNSGRKFHLEIASREFESDFMKLMTKGNPAVAKKLRESLKRWSDNEFKSDGQVSLIPALYLTLKNEGYDFSSSDPPPKKSGPQIKDPNFVESQEEEEQILKAIELSLKETGSPRSAASSTKNPSLYPSVNMSAGSLVNNTPPKEPKKVRALYDFEAAEDNELTFHTGEIIVITDDSDANWWKGSNHRGEGLFPASFVTADLSVEPEKYLIEKAKKMVQFKEEAEVTVVEEEPVQAEINEEKIDRLLHLLHEADPTNADKDTDEMLKLEREVDSMGPQIDSELERVDRKHAQLTQLSADLVEALGLYHSLMRELPFPVAGKVSFEYPSTSQQMKYVPPDMPSLGGPQRIPGLTNYPPGLPTLPPGIPGFPPGQHPFPPGHPNFPHGQTNFPYQSMPHMMPSQQGPPSHGGNLSQLPHPNSNMRPPNQNAIPGPHPHQLAQHQIENPQTNPYPMMPIHEANRPQAGVQMPQMHDMDRRIHEQQLHQQHQAHQQQHGLQQHPPGMAPFQLGQGVPNFGLPANVMQTQFPPSGPQSQIANGPQMQGGIPPHYVSSNGHITQ